MAMKRVGLLLMVDLPELGGLHAVLQVRGTFNSEKMAPESYPGGCQLTCAGKVEPGESPVDALEREVREELGLEGLSFDLGRFFWGLGSDEMEIVALVCRDAAILQKLRLHPGTGGLRLVREDTPILDLKTFRKVDGVYDRRVVAMFPDEVSAVRQVFKTVCS